MAAARLILLFNILTSKFLMESNANTWALAVIPKPENRADSMTSLNAGLLGVARGVLVALQYPRGSEAQVRCLEEIGQDAAIVIDRAGEAERLVKPVEHYTAFQAGDVWAFETPYGVSAGYMSKVSAQNRADATRRQDEERRLKAGGAL